MVHLSKRMKEAKKLVDKTKPVSLEAALESVSDFPKVKFDESVELHFHLTIDPKKTEQMVRGTVVLPHGTGKKIKIAVFCKGEQADLARKLGADYVGDLDLIDQVAKGFLDFERVIATPEMMRDLSKLGKVLGPRGLMPSPKTGTVTNDIENTIKEVKAGKIEFKSDKQAGLHVAIGKRSFAKDKLNENAVKVLDAVNHAKPSSVKGDLIKSLFLSTTMGPSIRLSI
jgi:large subunit ribosomal protein L1